MERTINWPRTIRIGIIIIARAAIVITGVDKFGPWTEARAPRCTATFVSSSHGTLA
jgi:hypothetical protein